jgi:hypothetical protein
MKKPPDKFTASPAHVMMRIILRSVLGGSGFVLLLMGARIGHPLISLIGAVHIVFWLLMSTHEET